MAKSKINRLEDQTIKIEFSLSWETIEKEYNKTLEAIARDIEIKGFRKGKAPKKTVEKKIGRQTIYQKVLHVLVPQAYAEIIRQNDLKPIVNPRIKATSLEENQDWQFEAETCETPQVKLDNYQAVVSKINTKDKIWTPKKDQEAAGKEETKAKNSQSNNQRLNQIFNALITEVKITLPKILLKSEVDRLLANLLDDIKKLGLTLDSYLSSKDLEPEQLRKQYEKMAEENLKLEFILSAVADDLKIQVNPDEVEKILEKAKNEEEKKPLEAQKYYLASILRRRKTIDKLLTL